MQQFLWVYGSGGSAPEVLAQRGGEVWIVNAFDGEHVIELVHVLVVAIGVPRLDAEDVAKRTQQIRVRDATHPLCDELVVRLHHRDWDDVRTRGEHLAARPQHAEDVLAREALRLVQRCKSRES